MELLVFDKEKDSVTRVLDLAYVYNDGPVDQWATSCIFRNKDGSCLLVTQRHYSFSHSVENEKDTTVDRRNSFYLFDPLKPTGDTLSKDSATITTAYPQIMKRLAQY